MVLLHTLFRKVRKIKCNKTDFSIINTISSASKSSDFSVSIVFGDSSIATITFSAKGHTFEGVREYLNLHKGNLLASLKDFQYLDIMRGSKSFNHKTFYRSHGHVENIRNSLKSNKGESNELIQATALLFLGVKESLDKDKTVNILRNEIPNEY